MADNPTNPDMTGNALTRWLRAGRGQQTATLIIVVIALGVAIQIAAGVAGRFLRMVTQGIPMRGALPHNLPMTVPAGIALIVLLVALLAAMGWLYVRLSRWLEQREPTEFEARQRWSRLGIGVVTGAAIMAGVIGVMALTGHASFEPGKAFGLMGATIIPVVFAPFFEELLFRGVFFRKIEEQAGTMVALLASSAFFGFAHISNPNSSVAAATSIAIEAGLLLGLAYAATRSLWFPMGVHFGWNFTEGNVFGAADSGNAVPGILHTNFSGNPLITGGAFGPEASLITPVICLLLSAWLYRLTLSRGYWVSRASLRQAAPSPAGRTDDLG